VVEIIAPDQDRPGLDQSRDPGPDRHIVAGQCRTLGLPPGHRRRIDTGEDVKRDRVTNGPQQKKGGG
jgi:hypothetical protein